MPVRKKHNPQKRYQVQAEAAVSGLCFGMLAGVDDNLVVAYRLSTGLPQKVGPTVAKALSDCCFKFAILLVVTSVEGNGKERTVTHYERLASAYRHVDLIDHLNSEHDALIQSEKDRGNDVTGAGWMVCPVPKLPDDELERLMLAIFNTKKEASD